MDDYLAKPFDAQHLQDLLLRWAAAADGKSVACGLNAGIQISKLSRNRASRTQGNWVRMLQPCGRRLRIAASGALRLPVNFPAGLAALEALRSPSRRLNVFSRNIEPKIYGRVGNLEVRLARTWSEIKLAQRLRYQVFFEEMSATPTRLAQFRRRDEDAYDAICDHLAGRRSRSDDAARGGRPERPKVVGTYRILRQEVAERGPGFYSASEYDIAPLLAPSRATTASWSLGRSCVLAPYRSKRSVELLWHGLWTYVRENRIDVMIGCASFEGTDPDDARYGAELSASSRAGAGRMALPGA